MTANSDRRLAHAVQSKKAYTHTNRYKESRGKAKTVAKKFLKSKTVPFM